MPLFRFERVKTDSDCKPIAGSAVLEFETQADTHDRAVAQFLDAANDAGTFNLMTFNVDGSFDTLYNSQEFVITNVDTQQARGPISIGGGLTADQRAKRATAAAAWSDLCDSVAANGINLGKIAAFDSADVTLTVQRHNPTRQALAAAFDALREFAVTYATYWVAAGNDGNIMWLFAVKPTTYEIRELDVYHRGGACEIIVDGKTITIELDLD